MYTNFTQQGMYQQPMYTANPYQRMQPAQTYLPQQQVPPAQPVSMQTAPMVMVTSRAQAELSQIPFDGLPYFFYNTATREIHMKQYDGSSGKCPIVDYQPPTQAKDTPSEYATVDMIKALDSKINALAGLVPPHDDQAPAGRHAKKEDAE